MKGGFISTYGVRQKSSTCPREMGRFNIYGGTGAKHGVPIAPFV
jgi:hypothetical protein